MKNYNLLNVVATQLNGLQYPLYPKRYDYNGVSLIDYCKQNGIVIVCGSSDDLMELYGAINEEYDCWEGGTICFDESGEQADANDYFPITAIWAKDDISWQYEFEPKHEEFTIYEDADIYCKGIVFFVDDLKRKATAETTPKDRVISERDELKERFDKLSAFIGSEKYKSLKEEMRSLLLRQVALMDNYLQVLNERLAIWED